MPLKRHFMSLAYAFLLAPSILGLNAHGAPKPWQNLQWIDPSQVLFGYEATFQDKQMSLNDTSDTAYSGHKRDKINEMMRLLPQEIGLRPISSQRNFGVDHKPFAQRNFNEEMVRFEMEPGAIEINMTPKPIFSLKTSWAPIFRLARKVQLKNSVFPLGVGGGGGHIHVGGESKEVNPFLLNANMLRNVLVYTHHHPSLLFGFSEGFDVGPQSSARTLHDPALEIGFYSAIHHFDEWYIEASPEERRTEGLHRLGGALLKYAPLFMEHNVFINFEHASRIVLPYASNHKATVEWRNIRPLKNPAQVEAMAGLILRLMDRGSNPYLVVPLTGLAKDQFMAFMSPSYVEADWELVKSELGIDDPILNQMIHDYTRNPDLNPVSYGGGVVRGAYSDHARMGKFLEFVKPLAKGRKSNTVMFQGRSYPAAQFKKDGQDYLVAIVRKPVFDCSDALAGADFEILP